MLRVRERLVRASQGLVQLGEEKMPCTTSRAVDATNVYWANSDGNVVTLAKDADGEGLPR